MRGMITSEHMARRVYAALDLPGKGNVGGLNEMLRTALSENIEPEMNSKACHKALYSDPAVERQKAARVARREMRTRKCQRCGAACRW